MYRAIIIANQYFCVRENQLVLFFSLPQRGLLDNEKVHLPRGQHVVTPTTLDENNCDKSVGVSRNIAAKRRKLTYDAANKIHSNPSSTEPEVQCATANGLWNTLVTNVKSKVVTDLLKRSKTVCKTVVPQIVAKSVSRFEKSSNNFLRSVSVLYRGGILSKRKYCNIRSSESFDYDIPTKRRKRTEFEEGCRVPALVPYKDLMKFIEVQDIGKLNSIPQATSEGEIENEREEVNANLLPVVPGHYIDLKERLLQMADLYLYIDSHKANFLTWFGKDKGHFLVAVGADGAPFGKANEACAWLVSFLNVSERVASPDDNFLKPRTFLYCLLAGWVFTLGTVCPLLVESQILTSMTCQSWSKIADNILI